MPNYTHKISYTLNGNEYTAQARSHITYPELVELGGRIEGGLNNLSNTNLNFSMLFIRAYAIIKYFTDIDVDSESLEFELSDLIYDSNFYDQLEDIIAPRLLDDIYEMCDRTLAQKTEKSSLDIFFDQLTAILIEWDEKLGKNIDPKKLGKLISKLSALNLNENMVKEVLADRLAKATPDNVTEGVFAQA